MAESIQVRKEVARPFRCADCSKGFTRQENLKRHIHTHHKGFNARKFQCQLCNARFARSDLRKRHVENCHVQQCQQPETVLRDTRQENLHIPFVAEPSPSAWLEMLMSAPVTLPNIGHIVPAYFVNERLSDARCKQAFFDKFHQNFPILHESTFDAISAPTPMQNAIIIIGSLYCSSGHTDVSRKTLFDAALMSLQHYVEQNRSRYQEIWVLQTFLLLECFGIYGGDDENFVKAQRVHRELVDAMRMLQMSHDGLIGTQFQESSDEAENDDPSRPMSEDTASLEAKWQAFIKKESRKRCIYSLYLLDSQLAVLCNLRPMLSSLEIKYDLPCCEDVWFATSASDWTTFQRQQLNTLNDSNDDNNYSLHTPPKQGFFYEASQTLLHSDQGKKHPKKLRLLWASPFTAVILVTQLQMMTRELTHASCLLERPKCQRRMQSVLTDKQHAQISQALKGIAEMVPRERSKSRDCNFLAVDAIPHTAENSPLWQSFWVLWHYSSITLSHPDSLLVTGVVECNLPSAIATAGQLATPRSKDTRDIYDDRDVFRILNDLTLTLETLSESHSLSPSTLDNPFTTLLGFKICLEAWRLVRLTMPTSPAHDNSPSVRVVTRTDPCKFVLDAIMAFANNSQERDGDVSRSEVAYASGFGDGRLMGDDAGGSEVRFLEWIVGTFKARKTWPVGEWVVAVMEESLERAREAFIAGRSEIQA